MRSLGRLHSDGAAFALRAYPLLPVRSSPSEVVRASNSCRHSRMPMGVTKCPQKLWITLWGNPVRCSQTGEKSGRHRAWPKLRRAGTSLKRLGDNPLKTFARALIFSGDSSCGRPCLILRYPYTDPTSVADATNFPLLTTLDAMANRRLRARSSPGVHWLMGNERYRLAETSMALPGAAMASSAQ